MDRRRFLTLTTQATLMLAARNLFGQAEASIPADIARLYKQALVIDTLCAPFVDDAFPAPDNALAQVRQSGVTAINCTISGRTYEETVNHLARVEAWIERYPDLFLQVRQHSDIARAKHENKIGILPGFQETKFLEDDPSRIEVFRDLGVRIMQLTYNLRSAFGDGCLEPGNAGLSKAGVDAVHKMNTIGVAVDMSHSGYRTTSDAIETSAKPILITHSGCAAVYAHPRNKPDAILKSLADRGGYFGVYLMPYLVASPTVPNRERVTAHLLHAINVCGADHVGIGSDGSIEAVHLSEEQKKAFDEDIARRKKLGIGAPGEDRYPYVPDLTGPQHMEIIAWELQKRGQPMATIEKVLGANFHRVLGDIWGTA
jgi:membrane dipeptidase